MEINIDSLYDVLDNAENKIQGYPISSLMRSMFIEDLYECYDIITKGKLMLAIKKYEKVVDDVESYLELIGFFSPN